MVRVRRHILDISRIHWPRVWFERSGWRDLAPCTWFLHVAVSKTYCMDKQIRQKVLTLTLTSVDKTKPGQLLCALLESHESLKYIFIILSCMQRLSNSQTLIVTTEFQVVCNALGTHFEYGVATSEVRIYQSIISTAERNYLPNIAREWRYVCNSADWFVQVGSERTLSANWRERGEEICAWWQVCCCCYSLLQWQ